MGKALGLTAVLAIVVAFYVWAMQGSGTTWLDIFGLVQVLGFWGLAVGGPAVIIGILVLIYFLVKGVVDALQSVGKTDEDMELDGLPADSHAARVLKSRARKLGSKGPIFRVAVTVVVVLVLCVGLNIGCPAAINYVKKETYIKEMIGGHTWTRDEATFYRLTGREAQVWGDGSDTSFARWMIGRGKWNEDGFEWFQKHQTYPPKYGWTNDGWWGEVDRQRKLGMRR